MFSMLIKKNQFFVGKYTRLDRFLFLRRFVFRILLARRDPPRGRFAVKNLGIWGIWGIWGILERDARTADSMRENRDKDCEGKVSDGGLTSIVSSIAGYKDS